MGLNTASRRKDRSPPDEGDPAARQPAQPGQAPRSDHVVALDRVAEALGDALDQLLELRVLEGVEAPAAVADRVVVVLAAGVGGLEAGGAVDVDAADEPEAREHVDGAVDAREADAALLVAQAVVDRLGAQAALLAGEQPQDLLARAARAVPRARELLLRVRLPTRACHAGSVAENENQFQ